MSRASRLAEIAKANQPAFTGAQWWLGGTAALEAEKPAASDASQAEPVLAAVEANAGSKSSMAGQGIAKSAAPVAAQKVAARDSADLPSKLSGLKERFLWLGRKHRNAEAQ